MKQRSSTGRDGVREKNGLASGRFLEGRPALFLGRARLCWAPVLRGSPPFPSPRCARHPSFRGGQQTAQNFHNTTQQAMSVHCSASREMQLRRSSCSREARGKWSGDIELRRAKKGKASSCAPALSQQSNLMLENRHRWEEKGERENFLQTFALNIGSSASQEWWICDTPRAYVLVVCT